MNKTVIVTGGARGIGKQICIDFANEGYNICINYNNSEKEATELKKQLEETNLKCMIYKADVSDSMQVDLMVDKVINTYGSIDVLVNNAGVCKYGVMQDTTCKEFNEVVNTNLLGTFNVTKSVLSKYMINKKSGKIINISSMWGITGGSCEVIYSMTKAGIIGFTKALAKEVGPSNITVNAVAPGVINTDMIKNLTNEDIENLKEEVPLQRIGTPNDISKVITFLASDKSDYITGQVISVNGGLVI